MKNEAQELIDILFAKASKKNKEFSEGIIFTKQEIIGVSLPILHPIAKKISKKDALSFLKNTTHTYYEEMLVEGLVLGTIEEEEVFFPLFEEFIKRIDNWATCDIVMGHISLFQKKDYTSYYVSLLKRKEPFVQRVGIVLLMNYSLTEDKIDFILKEMEQIHTDHYYVNMAIAWLISSAYVLFPKKITSFLKKTTLDAFPFQKAISKINDSKRVSKEEKEKLKALSKKRAK